MPPRVVLVGAPGAGKSTVGRLVARRLDVGFRDTDHDVEASAGKSVADVFLDDGEEAFRAAELSAVHTALAEHDGVLALGGGAVLSAETRRLLAGHQVVHLQVGLTDAASRVGFGRARPVIALNPRAQLKVLLDERAPLYAEVATAVVVTDGLAPEDIAAAVVAAIS
jgi:shikimate kinase